MRSFIAACSLALLALALVVGACSSGSVHKTGNAYMNVPISALTSDGGTAGNLLTFTEAGVFVSLPGTTSTSLAVGGQISGTTASATVKITDSGVTYNPTNKVRWSDASALSLKSALDRIAARLDGGL